MNAAHYNSNYVMSDGTRLFLEPVQRPGLDRRAFKQVANGYEWAHFSDVIENGEFARFYGYTPKELPATITT